MSSTTNTEIEQRYGEEYYRSQLGPEPYDRTSVAIVNFFCGVADQLIRSLKPKTAFDAGCAMGFLVEAFWDRGVKCEGLDISPYAISNVRRDIQPFCRVDSLANPIEGSYDLITCIEVLEHMPERHALQAIANLAAATDVILFSSSFTDLSEPTHVNVHQPIWWLEQFREIGFAPDLTYDAGFVSPQAMLLRRQAERQSWDVLRLFSEFLRYKCSLGAKNAEMETQAAEKDQEKQPLMAQIVHLEGLVASAENLRSDVQQFGTQLEATNESYHRLIQEQSSMKSALEALSGTVTASISHVQAQIEQVTGRLLASESRLEQIETTGKVANAESEARLKAMEESLADAMESGKSAISRSVASFNDEISDLRAKYVVLLQEREHTVLRREYEQKLAAQTQLWRAEITPLREALMRHAARLNEVEKWSARVSSLETVTDKQAQALSEQNALAASVAKQVSEILQSRIWQTLVSAGRLLLKFTGRG